MNIVHLNGKVLSILLALWLRIQISISGTLVLYMFAKSTLCPVDSDITGLLPVGVSNIIPSYRAKPIFVLKCEYYGQQLHH